MKKILNVVGARPNFMKILPIISELNRYRDVFDHKLVHTGQHYDSEMSSIFFKDLSLPKPDIHLGVGSGTHAVQTANIMIKFERVVLQEKPDLVIVVGDVNSTLACSIVCSKLGIQVSHVEAGLRSFDRSMPEEINRVVTDALSDFLFTTSQEADENLVREGISRDKIFFVGNVMIDTLLENRKKAESSCILEELNLKERDYAILTLHRPSNVDNRENLVKILKALNEIQRRIPIVYPIHPRTRKRLEEFSLEEDVKSIKNLRLIDPIGYLDFLRLMIDSSFVLTDSGGIQEETTFLNIPCLTLRENTERPITVEIGTNIIVGTCPKRIVEEAVNILNGNRKEGKIPPLWDGKASKRIVDVLRRNL